MAEKETNGAQLCEVTYSTGSTSNEIVSTMSLAASEKLAKKLVGKGKIYSVKPLYNMTLTQVENSYIDTAHAIRDIFEIGVPKALRIAYDCTLGKHQLLGTDFLPIAEQIKKRFETVRAVIEITKAY